MAGMLLGPITGQNKKPDLIERKAFIPSVVVVIVAVQVLVGFVIYSNFWEWEDRGAFGDMFGAVNTLFSGLALAGIVYAILLQRKELEYQRQDIQLTRVEIAKSAEAQQKTAEILEDQLVLQRLQKKAAEEERVKSNVPVFQFPNVGHTTSGPTFKIEVNFENHGGPLTDFRINKPKDAAAYYVRVAPEGSLRKDGKGIITLSGDKALNLSGFKFNLEYKDRDNNPGTKKFLLNLSEKKVHDLTDMEDAT